MRLYGSELKVGDVIEVWWNPGRDQIVSLYDYSGPLAYLWKPAKAQLAGFAINKTGMTIEPQMTYEVLNRRKED